MKTTILGLLFGLFLTISYGQEKHNLIDCGYFSITDKYKPTYLNSENELPESIIVKIKTLIKNYCSDSFANGIYYSGGRILDYNKMKQLDTSINYQWEVPYYELCYSFRNSNIGTYSFKICLDSSGMISKRWKELELPNFNSDPTKLIFLSKKKIYSVARKYIKTKDATVNINFFNGNIVWEFTKSITQNGVRGYKTIVINGHTGEKLQDRFVMNNFL